MDDFYSEVSNGGRFRFGDNWGAFLSKMNDDRIREAENSLKRMIKCENLEGKRFLDIGCGSGIFSLAARRLGAQVYSFDYDHGSVACAEELKKRYFNQDPGWRVEHGSILDFEYVNLLGKHDIVYSWGVLHHTGMMPKAMKNAALTVAVGGLLFISIYNKQPRLSSYWLKVKKLYNRLPQVGKTMMVGFFTVYFIGGPFLLDLARMRNPFSRYMRENRRGMSALTDITDWIGGLPFEVASPEEVFRFYRDRGFTLVELTTNAGRHGCNEYVFQKSS